MTSLQPKPRHELKYEISYGEYIGLRLRLAPIMRPDIHTGSHGTYLIRSLYFDNCYDKALKEKIDGIKNRDKYRIRCYNNDSSFILLEKKSKRNNLCLKSSCKLTKNQCEDILNGNFDFSSAKDNEVLTDFYVGQTAGLLRPKTIVVYKREPYVFEAGNVRITFDSDIKSGLYSTDFFDWNLPLMPVTQNGKIILEIKFDEFLPDVIRQAIQCSVPRIGAFSKYASCRQFE